MKEAKVVMLGTGNPNANPDRSGPCVAVIVGDDSYIVDFGPGIVRQSSKAYIKYNIEALKPKNLKVAFLTHLHSDHSAGYPDLILSPWVLGRDTPLMVFGPKGTKDMSKNILEAYRVDIEGRLGGLEPANPQGYKVEASDISSGVVYEDDNVRVEAFRVKHDPYESYGYKFITEDKSIVISGDTAPCDTILEYAKDCDILVHEVYSAEGLKCRDERWQSYHSNVHTSSIELGCIAEKINPRLLVLYHQLFMLNLQRDSSMIDKCMEDREKGMLSDISKHFKGRVVSAKDLDIFK